MTALLAALPIGLVVGTMAGLGWRAASAGALGLGTALILALGPFGYGSALLPELGPTAATAGALAEALFLAATVLWIVFPALCLYELQARSGGFETLRAGLARLSDRPRTLALIVGFFFALFMEGAAGFGAPVALAAPMLVGLGFAPARAVTLALIGHAAGVSFGAIGTPALPQIAATGLSPTAVAEPAAMLHAALGWILVLAVVYGAGDRPPSLGDLGRGLLAALLFFGPFYALAATVGPELPTLGGAVIGGLVFALLVRRRSAERDVEAGALLRAVGPYLVLLALVLATRLVPPLREALRELALEWTLFGLFAGRFEPLYHPGTLLMLGFLLGGALQGRSIGELAEAARAALGRIAPVALALAAMLALSRLMIHAGMVEALAEAAARAGAAWPLVAPFVAVLGTFVTGSATASNILFSDFQAATAEALSLPVATLQGAQNFGAAVGNIVCPHNIIAGAATVGLVGGEGAILRATAPICLLYAAAGGALLLILL